MRFSFQKQRGPKTKVQKQRGQTYTLHSFNFFFTIATFWLLLRLIQGALGDVGSLLVFWTAKAPRRKGFFVFPDRGDRSGKEPCPAGRLSVQVVYHAFYAVLHQWHIPVQRPLQNAPFCPISASGSNFNPQNTQCIPAVKIFAFLELEQNWAFFKGLVQKESEFKIGKFKIS